ncbi:unnamed protein product [marine sediment metagenome]|uniref:Uncharacterized protein n=1 Tax=marine sediment metagenome TaxID=412755 RepID=X1Q474_9ZZZZ
MSGYIGLDAGTFDSATNANTCHAFKVTNDVGNGDITKIEVLTP